MIASILTFLFLSFKKKLILLFAKIKGFKQQHNNVDLHVTIAIAIPTFLAQELFASHIIIRIKLLPMQQLHFTL